MERLNKDRSFSLTLGLALATIALDVGTVLWRGDYMSVVFLALIGGLGTYHVLRIRAIDLGAGKLAADLLVGLGIVGALSLGA